MTPSHLISGRRLLSLPDTTRSGADNSSTGETVTRRARYLHRLMDRLWNRWRREYIPALREFHKLKLDSAGQTVQIGDIVSVHDESLPRAKWRMGVVHELVKGVDKKTRGTVVRIAHKGKSLYLRASLRRHQCIEGRKPGTRPGRTEKNVYPTTETGSSSRRRNEPHWLS